MHKATPNPTLQQGRKSVWDKIKDFMCLQRASIIWIKFWHCSLSTFNNRKYLNIVENISRGAEHKLTPEYIPFQAGAAPSNYELGMLITSISAWRLQIQLLIWENDWQFWCYSWSHSLWYLFYLVSLLSPIKTFQRCLLIYCCHLFTIFYSWKLWITQDWKFFPSVVCA